MAVKRDNGPSYEEIIRDVRGGNIKPVYYLMGDEDYYIDRVAQFIVDSTLGEMERDFNLSILYGPDTNAQRIIQEARQFPVMAERRVVWLREAQSMNDREQLAAYVKNPNPQTILIVCHKHGTLDSRRSLAKEVKKVGVLFESRRLYDRELPGFITSYLRRQKREIESAAVQMLCEHVGSDLNMLASEMDKLVLAIPMGESRVTTALVEQQTGMSKDYNGFELQNALSVRDIYKANQIVKYFDGNPKNFALPPLLASLFGFFSDVMMAYYAPDKSEVGVANWLGKAPWQIKQAILPAKKNYSGRKVMAILAEIRKTDGLSKGVGGCRTAPGDLLKELIFFILH